MKQIFYFFQIINDKLYGFLYILLVILLYSCLIAVVLLVLDTRNRIPDMFDNLRQLFETSSKVESKDESFYGGIYYPSNFDSEDLQPVSSTNNTFIGYTPGILEEYNSYNVTVDCGGIDIVLCKNDFKKFNKAKQYNISFVNYSNSLPELIK